MPSAFQRKITDSNRVAFATLFLVVLLSGLSALSAFGITNPLIFLGTLGIASIVIMRYPIAGVAAAVSVTMLWERFFTLTPFAVGDTLYKIYPLDIVLLATALAVLVRLRSRELKALKFESLDRVIIVWIGVVTAVFVYSTLFLAESKIELAFSTWKNYAFYALLYFLIRYLVQHKHDFALLLRTILWSGVGILGFVAVGIALGQGLWTEFTPLSTEGTRLLAPTHAFYLTIPFMLLLFKSEIKRYAREFLQYRGVLLWAWGIGVLVSLARHLWVSLAAQLGGAYMRAQEVRFTIDTYVKKPVAIIAVIGSLAIGFLALNPSFDTDLQVVDQGKALVLRFSSFFSTGDVSFDWRKALWQESLRQYAQSPWLGIGFGREVTFPLPGYVYTTEARNLHNSPLGMLLQGGLITIASFGIMLLAAWRLYQDNREKTLPYALMLGGFLINSIFGTYFEINLLVVFFWLILGLMRTRVAV